MKFSVIVPYWNAERFLERCCESLHKQTGDFEFLLVNDNSTDNGESIAEHFAEIDDRFITLQNERTKGVSGARNTGIDHASCEWITFLDADDEMLEDSHIVFERMSRLDKTANIIQSNHLRYYEAIDKTKLKYTNQKGIYKLDNLPRQWCMVWNKLYRLSFIADTRFVEDFQYGEDEVFNLDLLAKDGRIFHTQTHTVTTLRHFDNKESLSHIKGKKELLKQVHALEDYILRTENPKAITAAMDVLSEHWASARYKKAMGGV